MIDIALLGTSGMMPLPNRFLTSLLCRLNGRLLLIDCGEGTQVSMKILGWGFKNLDCICFTHFHADHIAGLPGLLLSVGNSGRTENITIIGPKGVGEIVKSLCVIAPELPFGLEFIELSEFTNDITTADYVINTIALDHRIACYGYSVNVLRAGKFEPERAEALGIPKQLWSKLQKNENVIIEDKIFTPEMVLGNKRKGIKVCYATDTRPIPNLVEFVHSADLYVAEGIYAEDSKIDKAIEYKHMLFSEAATVAKNANVKELWLTHFSPSLIEPEQFADVAQSIFENTKVGFDRISKTIFFDAN